MKATVQNSGMNSPAIETEEVSVSHSSNTNQMQSPTKSLPSDMYLPNYYNDEVSAHSLMPLPTVTITCSITLGITSKKITSAEKKNLTAYIAQLPPTGFDGQLSQLIDWI